jgi:hypothetical protein
LTKRRFSQNAETDVMNLKIFSPKNLEKLANLTQIKLPMYLGTKKDHNIGLKTPIFSPKIGG